MRKPSITVHPAQPDQVEASAPLISSLHLVSSDPPVAARGPLLFKKQLALLGLLLFARGLSGYASSGEAPKPAKPITLALPTHLAGWQGKDVKVDPFVYEELHPDAVLQKRYTLPQSNTSLAQSPQIETLVMYSHDTFGFHPPEVCIRMQGWVITNQEQRELTGAGQVLNLSVITAEQHQQKRHFAYSFSDTGGRVAGRTEAFANMILARASRQSAGTLELQFAYDGRSLLPNGEFTPQFKALMLKVAASVRHQLAQSSASSVSP